MQNTWNCSHLRLRKLRLSSLTVPKIWLTTTAARTHLGASATTHSIGKRHSKQQPFKAAARGEYAFARRVTRDRLRDPPTG